MSHPSDFPMSVPQDFSNLEVVHGRSDEGLKEVRLLDADKEVHTAKDLGKEIHNPDVSARSPLPTVLSTTTSTYSLPDKEGSFVGEQRAKRICGLSVRGFWLLLGLTVVAVAVAVGVPLGFYFRNRTLPSPGTSLPAASNSSLGTPESSPPPVSAPAAPREASPGLASVAWNDTNGILQYRVYYQDDKLAIKESAWNASSNKWQQTRSIGTAKARTPITAAVTGPEDFAFELSVYALGENGSIVEWNSKDAETFGIGNMTSQNVVPANASSLTALWDRHHGCSRCANTLLFAYERSDGQLEIGNYTQNEWTWNTLQSSPAQGTGLALALRWQRTSAGDIRLFYQTKDGQLVSQDYNGPSTPPSFTWLSRETLPIAQLGSISPLTTFTWGTTSSGDAEYNDMISANSSGLAVNFWSGVYSLNGQGFMPPTLTGVDEAVALAANADKQIYALQQNGTIAEFEMLSDEYHWAYMGNVNTG